MSIAIRPATASDASRLREIAAAAKASWGYDRALVGGWAARIDVADGGRSSKEVHVAEVDREVAGWTSVSAGDDRVWALDDLWVEPGSMGRGVGSALFSYAVELVRGRGGTRLEWEAEPNAIGFYERLGATYVRDSEPSEWGRALPVLGIHL